MIEEIPDLPKNTLGFSASGKVVASDYQTVLIPALEAKLRESERVRLLFILGTDFDSFTGAAAWEDTKVGLKHLTDFERVAIVTNVDWLRNSVKAFGFAMPGEVRVFGNDEEPEAREWIAEPAPDGDLEFELLHKKRVLVLRPHGELDATDFERIANEIDPFVAEHGQLHGVMIVAEHFPGWGDLGAFAAHFRFIKEHRDKVSRMAIVTSDRLMSAIPRIASHLVVSEARHFPMDKEDDALAWIGDG